MDNKRIPETRHRLLERRKRVHRARFNAIALYTFCIIATSAIVSTLATFICINAFGYSIVQNDALVPAATAAKSTESIVDQIENIGIDSYNNIITETISATMVASDPPPIKFEYIDPTIVEETTIKEIVESKPVQQPTVYINPNAIPDGTPMDKYYGWSEKDYQNLLYIIVGECQNCSEEEQMETGSVVLNRLYNTKYFGYADTISDIIHAPGQYTCFSAGTAYRTPTELNKKVVMQLLKYGSVSSTNVIYQSLFPQGDGVYKYFPDTGTYICYQD